MKFMSGILYEKPYHCAIDKVERFEYEPVFEKAFDSFSEVKRCFYEQVNRLASEGYRITAVENGLVEFMKDGEHLVVTMNLYT